MAESPKNRLNKLKTAVLKACFNDDVLKKDVPVFGDGPAPCSLMVIGEAPGRDETKEGIPFVGKAGKYLTSVLKDVFEKERGEFYITNVVKIWPVIETKRLKTRKPTREEEEFFLPYLVEEIKIISPKAILAVGKTAFNALLPEEPFTPGEWASFGEIKVMPVYHPSYILRKQKTLKENTEKLKKTLKKVRKEIS